jgi:ammonia channel protein AmtB
MKKDESKRYYSYLEVNKTQQAGLMMITAFMYAMLTLAIMANIVQKGKWTNLLLPSAMFLSPLLLYPLVEFWVYQPWQGKARKYERHYLD